MVEVKKWADYLSGYISGLLSSVICAPLDITRTRMNLNHTTHHQLQGFFHALTDSYKRCGYKGYYEGNYHFFKIYYIL